MKKKILVISIIIGIVILSGCTQPDDELEIEETEVSIACWNLQIFGKTKASDVQLMHGYMEILDDYDIFIIQEIRDKSGDAVQTLIDKADGYNYIISERAGFTSVKEQYAVFYLEDKVVFDGAHDYAIEMQDKISRPPLQVSFRVNGWDFDVWTIHTDPDTVPSDLYYTQDIIGVQSKDTIIIGDLNADGAYYDEDDIQHFVEGWKWVIPNDVDTTVASSDNTYDRIIVNSNCENNVISYGVVDDITSEQSDHYLIYGVFDTTAE